MCEIRPTRFMIDSAPDVVDRLAEGHCPACSTPLERHDHKFLPPGIFTYGPPNWEPPVEPAFGLCVNGHGCFRMEPTNLFSLLRGCHATLLAAEKNGVLDDPQYTQREMLRRTWEELSNPYGMSNPYETPPPSVNPYETPLAREIRRRMVDAQRTAAGEFARALVGRVGGPPPEYVYVMERAELEVDLAASIDKMLPPPVPVRMSLDVARFRATGVVEYVRPTDEHLLKLVLKSAIT